MNLIKYFTKNNKLINSANKEKLLKFLKSKCLFLFLLAVLNLLVAFYCLKLPLWSSDSETYLSAAQYLQGAKLEEMPYNRLLTTPFMLYSSIFLSYFTGSFYGGMLAVNIIFYFLIIYVFYKLVFEIYQDHKTAFLSAILFLANYSMYSFGATYTADMGGWFFFILCSYFAVKYFFKQDKKYYFLTIIFSGIGVLFKEYGALGMISLTFLILASDFPLKRKFSEIIKGGLLFLTILILFNILFYAKFNYSYLDWYFYAISSCGSRHSIALLIKVLGWLFFAGWPIFILGLWQEKKFFNKTRIKILSALLPASLAFLAWPALTQRIAFILVPWLALISGFGLSKIKNKYLVYIIVIAYIIINQSITPFLIKAINLPF